MAQLSTESSMAEFFFEDKQFSKKMSWSCKTKLGLDHFLKAPFNTIIISDNCELNINFNGKNIITNWYLKICPNGYDKNNPIGDCVIGFGLTRLPSTESIRIKSMAVTRRIKIPQIGFVFLPVDC